MNLELVKIPHRQGVQPFGPERTGYSFTWFSGTRASVNSPLWNSRETETLVPFPGADRSLRNTLTL
ncbi:hypothetical protein WR43_08890 [Mycolicibacter arupensis]|jgi:hypothetical protein|nr:hypothetical protein WR43_08890 [Mycolicibacter arupensis]